MEIEHQRINFESLRHPREVAEEKYIGITVFLFLSKFKNQRIPEIKVERRHRKYKP